MKRALLFFLPLLIGPALAAQDEARPPVSVSYTLDVTEPKSGAVKVEMRVENNRDDEVTIGIPTWAPGSYRTVSYFLAISDLEAEVGGKKVDVTATEHKSLWKVKTGRAPTFTIRYTNKPADVPQLRGNLTADHYDLQGPAAWLFVLDHLDGPHRVTFKLPTGWHVGTGLKKLGPAHYGERDYDTFIDCPIELGAFSLQKFEHDGVTYELVLHATEEFNVAKLVETCRKIVAEQTRMFGGAPFERYVIIYHFRNQMGGAGLEHLNSTHITFPMSRVKDDPASIASITSHEFFHLWNVKRIRPKELGPFDYTRPVRSKALWLCEGVTSYYGDLSLARAGVWTRDVYLDHLAREVNELQADPDRKTQSVEQAAWTVWDRGPNFTAWIDYYTKGELLGWLLDLKIRHATEGKKSFDDVMRHLYRTGVIEPAKQGKGPIGVGFEEGGILNAVNEVSGKDFTEFFTRYVSGTEELPYVEVAKEAGLSLTRRKALSISLQGMRVVEPAADSEAKKADVRRNDRIVKIANKPVANQDQLYKALEPWSLGDKVIVEFTRQGEKDPLQKELAIVEGPYAVKVAADPTEAQKALLRGWLAPSK